jgi:eukaryotic-like serine/threonine-protein kinase
VELAGYHVTPTVRLVRLLRQGPRGSVWEAESLALDTSLTVQVLDPAVAADLEAVELFLWCARVAAQEKCPRAVQFFGSGVTGDGVAYILQEAIPGESLADRVARLGRLTVEQTGRIVHQAAIELGAAHASGVLHRGIRPEGLFVQDEGRDEVFVKVLGFDISAQFDRRSGLPEAALGPARYMSPEELLSPQDVDTRADLWSLAAVAYFCLAGRAPFEARTIHELLVSIDGARFAPLGSRVGGLPAALDAFFERGLARDIDGRFRGALELDEAFRIAIAPRAFVVPSAAWSNPTAPGNGAWHSFDRGGAGAAPDAVASSDAPVVLPGPPGVPAEAGRRDGAGGEEAPDGLESAGDAGDAGDAGEGDDDFARSRDARRRGTMGFVSSLLLVAGFVAGGALCGRQEGAAASAPAASGAVADGTEWAQVVPEGNDAWSAPAAPSARSAASAASAASAGVSAGRPDGLVPGRSVAAALAPPGVSAERALDAGPEPAR